VFLSGVYFFMALMYGFCGIPYAYTFSYLRNSNAGAFSLLAVTNILLGKYCIMDYL
jgi:hypothetical protein